MASCTTVPSERSGGAATPGTSKPAVGRIFNARRPDRFPAVLLAADTGDMIEGVRLAAERGWTVTVRSGGHSWAAWSLRDDAVQGGLELARTWPSGAGRFPADTAHRFPGVVTRFRPLGRLHRRIRTRPA